MVALVGENAGKYLKEHSPTKAKLTHRRMVNCSIVSVSLNFYMGLIGVYVMAAMLWAVSKWRNRETAEI